MPSFDSGVTTFEQVTRSISNAITAVCFVAMVALAVHIVSHPQGPLEAYRFYHGNLSNFVDPHIETTVTRSGRSGFDYRYTVSNGMWGLQDIREIAILTRTFEVRRSLGDWGVSQIGAGPGASAILWSRSPDSDDDSGIRRGEEQDGFVIKSVGLPIIVQARAGHDLDFDIWYGLSTPAGRRVTRWVLGPRSSSDNISAHALLGSLVPTVHQASELGWIRDRDLAAGLRRTLTACAMEIKLGKIPKATAKLERLLRLVEAGKGIQFSDEGYALVVFNIEHVLSLVNAGPVEFTQVSAH